MNIIAIPMEGAGGKENMDSHMVEAFMACVVLVLTTVVVLEAQVEAFETVEQRCDERYGQGNWTLEPKQERSGWERFYIGQVFECKYMQEGRTG